MTRRVSILCAGVAVLDEVFRVERFPGPQMKTRASEFAAIVGGCAANAAIAIARLGGRARLAAALGAPGDPASEHMVASLAREGVDCAALLRIAGTSAALSSIQVDHKGDRVIVSHCDTRLYAATVGDPAACLDGIDVVLADNWRPALAAPICAAAHAAGLALVVDADGVLSDDDPLLKFGTHVIFSAEALRATSGSDDLAVALQRMRNSTPAFLAVTDGANDILWLDDATVRHLPVFPIDAIDTLAAGDVFHGAFALAFAEGRTEPEALRFAAAAAAIKCTRRTGGAGAPRRDEVEALLTAGRGGT
jgi:sugar/nucleoside kinase (ribokinase family)